MKAGGDLIRKSGFGWKDRMKLVVIIAAIYIFLNILGAGCPIKFLTGISCPGCGMTRAVLAAFRLQFREAFHFHPLFILAPFMLALYLFEEYLKPNHVKYLWAAIITVFITVYLLRLFVFQNDIVVIDLYNGYMVKLFKYIINLGGERW